MKVGYVVKRYPRCSEIFVVNETLGHEAAGLDLLATGEASVEAARKVRR